MSIEIKIPTIEGLTLKTKDTYVDKDIVVSVGIPRYDGSANEDVTPNEDGLIQNTITHYTNTRITKTRTYAFAGCSQLKELNLPNAISLASYTAQGTALEYIYFPKVKTLSNNCIYVNSKLKTLVFDSVEAFAGGALRDNPNLLVLVIRTPGKVCRMENTHVLVSCYHMTGTVHATHNPDGLQDGRIYVPDDLVEQYKVATNWSTYADIILPLSELPKEE